ncbi:DNA repair protein RAD50 [Chrysoperla carnea]|uniref:DNA repair protein RAD50 n=1 Tax=Chrysoperla carnea TaxID=189513 RepID=UPI001D077B48|nr:DNA repair protein RAD50 [Chrysoperla carnea]XP_044737321.1 DNA repair protein RAD50 [Chrysoperla carnea]
MSRLDKLNLSGIRSYGPDEKDEQTIQFQSPLTLILGQNGCGKTTIIEALKFATTGDLPPGCQRGAGFIFDPKLSSRSESKGQVKLHVVRSNGDEVFVCKALQATQRTNKVEYKRIDNTLTVRKPGEEEKSISSRCADIDVEMCVAMGVSKAILSNVIFCHQEDSSWPLEEGKKLKERFDAIFDALKYNKCLDVIRKMKKTRQTENKIIVEEVKGLEYKKMEVDKKKKNLKDAQDKLELTIQKITELEEKLKPITERLDEIKQIESDYDQRLRNLQMKKQRFEELKKDIKHMSNGLKILEHSDAELADTIVEFEKLLLLKQTELDEWEAKLKEKVDEEKKFLKSFGQEQVLVGQLRNEEKRNESQKTKRDKLLAPLSQQLEVTLDPITDSEKAVEIFGIIESKIEERKQKHEDLIKELDLEDQQLQTNIDKCRENKITMEQSVKSKMQQLRETKAEVRKKKREVDEANASSSHLEIIKDKLERNSKEYDSLTNSLDPMELAKQIEEETRKRDGAEKALDAVDKEVKTLQKFSNVQTELDVNRENVVRNEAEVQKIKTKHEESLNKLFNNELPDGNFKSALDKIKKEGTAKIRELNNSIKKAQKKVTELESDLKHRNEKQVSLEKELEENIATVEAQCEGKPFADVLNDMKNELEELQKDKGSYSNSKYMFTRFIEKLGEEEPCCPVCKRDFKDKQPEYVKEIINDITTQIEGFPTKLKEIETELTKKQKQYNKLVQLETVNERIASIKDELLPKIKEEIKEIIENLEKAKEELENLQQTLTPVQENHDLAQSVSSDVAVLDKHLAELKKIKTKVGDLEGQMSTATTSTRTLQEALNEQENLKSEMTTARRQVDTLQTRLNNFNEQKQYLSETKNKLVQQQLNIEKNIQGIVQIQARFAELQATESKLSTEVATLEDELLPVKKELDHAIDKKSQAKKDNKKKIDKSQSEIQTIQKHFHEIKSIQQTIDEFEKKNITSQLNEVIEKIEKLNEEKENHAKDKQKLQAEVDRIKNFLVSQKNYRRELIDNQKLREKQAEEATIKTEMEELSASMQKENYQAAIKEKRKLNESGNQIKSEKNRNEGRKDELTNNIAKLEKELSTEANQQAETKYKHKLMELKIRERVVDDIGKFINALDFAMIVHHKDKMVQINRTIRELWSKIYRGNDCDYIEIKTEQTVSSGKDGRRTFNYRVVQIRNGVELDMRGRCSAGQKVLACLIIRMALAETFSCNCGILALDEPTTNLDRANVTSLCRSLAEIVHARKGQKHFQLIVITHDEQFVQELTSVERLESYYKVDKNLDGKSVVSLMSAN